MNKLLPALTFVVFAQISFAATCANGTLASYIALGSGGCTVGSTTFSDFGTLMGEAGATAIATSSVNVMVSGAPYNPSVMFSTSQTAMNGALLESIFTYKLAGLSLTSAALSLSNSSETVDGAVTDLVNFCAGGSFGPDGVDGCTGTPGSLTALDGIQNSDYSPLGPASLLSVTDDFTVDSGTAGTATGGTFTNTFTAVPEPSSVALGTIGLALGVAIRRRRNKR